MPVTELAICHYKTPLTQSLIDDLQAARTAMETFTGYPFHLYIGTPDVLLIIGTWPSVETHMMEWIPSAENQKLLELLKDRVEVEDMFHIDLDLDSGGKRSRFFGPHTISHLLIVERRRLDGEEDNARKVAEEMERFVQVQEEQPYIPIKFVWCGGLRIDYPEGHDEKNEGRREYVLFRGWSGFMPDEETAKRDNEAEKILSGGPDSIIRYTTRQMP